MNLNRIFGKAVDCIFKTFKDFITTGTIVQPKQGYDPATGQPTGSETTYPISELIFTKYKLSRIDGQIIRALDRNAIFRVSELAVAVTDKMILRLVDGSEWDIISIDKDAAYKTYNLQTRRP